MKARIVKRTDVRGSVSYVIQQRHHLFFWWWVDAWVNSLDGANCRDYFDTLEEAKEHLCFFNGSKSFDEVIN